MFPRPINPTDWTGEEWCVCVCMDSKEMEGACVCAWTVENEGCVVMCGEYGAVQIRTRIQAIVHLLLLAVAPLQARCPPQGRPSPHGTPQGKSH